MKTPEENSVIHEFLESLTEALSSVLKYQYHDDIEWFDFHEEPEEVEFQLTSGKNFTIKIKLESVAASFRIITHQFWDKYLYKDI